MGLALFGLGLASLALVVLVHAPVRRPGEVAVLLFAPAWLAGELPVHAATLSLALGAAPVALGALASPEGIFGLLALLASQFGHWRSWRMATLARADLSRALGRPPSQPIHGRLPTWRYVIPFAFGDSSVATLRGVLREGERLRADIYLPRAPADTPRRVLVYVHGGGWVLGFRRFQGRHLMRRLARDGWVCVSIQYRLSPRATWPDHIVDVLRALAWVSRQAPTWSADPTCVAISGNSAGGHLATLAGLVAARSDAERSLAAILSLPPSRSRSAPPSHISDAPELDARALFAGPIPRVAAIVSWYGVYDLVSAFERAGGWPHGALGRLWRLLVMKRTLTSARDAYRAASPIAHVTADAPPLLLVHGTHDSLVPIATARAFARHCDAVAPGRATLVEVLGAQHAFDVFTSRRGLDAVEAAALWLDTHVPCPASAPSSP